MAYGRYGYGSSPYGGKSAAPDFTTHVVSSKLVYITADENPNEFESIDAFVHGHRSERSLVRAYLYGGLQAQTSQSAFIHSIIDSPEANVDGYVHGHSSLREDTPGYIAGFSVEIRSKSAFIMSIVDAPSSMKRAFVYGIGRDRFSQAAFIQVDNPIGSSQAAFIQIETPSEAIKHAFIVGAASVSSDIELFIAGDESARLSQRAFIQIQSEIDGSVGCFLHGEGATASQDAFIASPWTQLAYIQIETPVEAQRLSQYVRGHVSQFATPKNLYTNAHEVALSSKAAYIHMLTELRGNQSAYVVAPEPLEEGQDAFIRGIDSGHFTTYGYVFGKYIAPPSAIGLYLHVNEALQSSQGAFIQIENEIESSQPSFIRGLGPASIDPQPCYIDSRFTDPITPLPCYVHSETSTRVSTSAFVRAATGSIASKLAHISSSGNVTQPKQAFIEGVIAERESVGCFIAAASDSSDGQSAFIHSIYGSVLSKTPCFVVETSILSSNRSCYLEGERIGEIDSGRRAFVSGHGVQGVSDSIKAFISNIPTAASGLNRCFIQSLGVIGDWPMDDGRIDYGAYTFRDLSGLELDGSRATDGVWEQGPFVEVKCGN